MSGVTDLDTLGEKHVRLQEELKEVREQLAPLIREERERGETLQQITRRSGYHSVEAVRQIIDPSRRAEFNKRRRGTPKQNS